MLWRPKVGRALTGRGGEGSGPGARRRLPGSGRGPGRPSTCALCIVRRERRGEGGEDASLGSGGGAGVCRGGGA